MNGRTVAKRSQGRSPIQHIADDAVALAATSNARFSKPHCHQSPEVLESAISGGVGAVTRRSNPDSLTASSDVGLGNHGQEQSTRLIRPSIALQDLAAAWQVSTRTVRRRLDRGDLEGFRVGPQIRIYVESAASFERRHRI